MKVRALSHGAGTVLEPRASVSPGDKWRHLPSQNEDRPPRPLRILYVINQLGQGGAEQSLVAISEPLQARGIELTVCCLKRSGEMPNSWMLPQAELIGLRADSLATKVLELHRTIRKVGADVVHTTLFDADVIGRLASIGTGVPVLTSLVNTSYEPIRLSDPNVEQPGFYAAWLTDMGTAHLFTDHFHAITDAVKVSAVKRLRISPSRITVIERGRSASGLGRRTAARRAQARAALRLDAEDYAIINVARQEFQKGQKFLVSAVAKLLERGLRAKLLLVGRQGHATDGLRAQCAASPLKENVRFLGTRSDIGDLLCAADAFAFPSLYEGLGGALIEAMALELPIVASDLPAIREVLDGGCGLLTPPGDAAVLALELERVLTAGATNSPMVKQARRLFEEKFTIERTANRMASLYRRVSDAGAS